MFMMIDLTSPEIWASLLTLTALEVVLGIDNVIFISIIAQKLPVEDREKARKIGLMGALFMRVALLFSITWIIGLTEPLFTLFGTVYSWRDFVLVGGGLFLLFKGTTEIHNTVEGDEEDEGDGVKYTLFKVVMQIMILDVVFSLDSVITAIGMSDQLVVMVTAVTIAIGVMMWAAEPLARFIEEHPTIKMLALSFLLLVGIVLVADGLHNHVPRGYLYFAISFSIAVEFLNQLVSRRKRARKDAEKATQKANEKH
jgi:predicted tellurium resistance membrane protein TerC